MAISFVGRKSGSFAGKTTTTTVSLSGLSGGSDTAPLAGDLVIVTYGVGSTVDRALTITDTVPVNYTLIGTELYQNDTFDANQRTAYKFMPATPDASFILSGTGATADSGAYVVHVFRGVDPTTPLDVAAVTAGALNTRLVNPGAVTPVTAGAFIYIAGVGACATGGTYTAAYMATNSFVAVTQAGTNDVNVGGGYVAWTTGAYDPAAFAGGGTDTANDSWTAITVALRPAPTALVIADGGQAQTAENIVLTQEHVLAMADGGQAQTAENIVLTQEHVLAMADGAQAQSADNIALVQQHNIVVADGAQAQTAENLALTQEHVLAMAGGAQAQTAENIVIDTGVVDLIVADGAQAQTGGNIALTQEHVLAMADAAQAQSAENLALVQQHILTVADAGHAQTGENVVLIGPADLVVADSTHAHTADNVTYGEQLALTIDNANHEHIVGSVRLTTTLFANDKERVDAMLTEHRATMVEAAIISSGHRQRLSSFAKKTKNWR